METKKQFKNLDEVYNSTGYFWKYGRYVNYYKIDFTSKEPRLLYKPEGEYWEIIATGLRQINKMMKLYNLEVEID